MKPTEQEIKKAAIDFLEGKPYPIEVITSNQRVIYNFTEGANWAISQMQQELTTLKRHDKQLRSCIYSMTSELKILREALKDVKELANDEELIEWLFDNDYVSPQPPTK